LSLLPKFWGPPKMGALGLSLFSLMVNLRLIGSDNNRRQLQILESSLIQEHKPELNANIPSIPPWIFNLWHRFMHPPWRHAPSPAVRVPLSHVATDAPRHYVTNITAFRVSHLPQPFLLTDDKNLQQCHCSSVANVRMMVAGVTETSTMWFTSITLDVIFIIRLFTTSTFRIAFH